MSEALSANRTTENLTLVEQPISGVPAILEMAAYASTQGRSDAELGVVVQQLLDKEVNRSIANHGGKISLVEVREGKLFISMSGGCQGCASSQVTLRQGFEVMVKKVAPEIEEIVDATDHAAGRQAAVLPRAVSPRNKDAHDRQGN